MTQLEGSREENLSAKAINADIKKLQLAKNRNQQIEASGSWQKSVHCFDSKQTHALIAALAANRPLLVRGEPGVGKSQLARAAAAALGRRFISSVVQPDSEYADLLWSVDYTRRLADAQLASHTKDTARLEKMANYIGPGPIWWAFNWKDAKQQYADCCHNFCPPGSESLPHPYREGVVLLIDEIDKADISLANGLLEVLGNQAFSVPLLKKTIKPIGKPPLIVITSNDIRELPAALLRRCVILELSLPPGLQEHFIAIGAAHFPNIESEVLAEAAEQILEDRKACQDQPLTGLAEYLDLLRALNSAAQTAERQLAWLKALGRYFYKSHAVQR